MSTTRVSLADLAVQPHEYSAEEIAFRKKATDEDLHRGALADPDARPWTDDMLRRGRMAREVRVGDAAALDFVLRDADLSSDLPTWVVMDEKGEIVHLQAANIRRALPGTTSSAVKIVSSPTREDRIGAQPPQRGEPG